MYGHFDRIGEGVYASVDIEINTEISDPEKAFKITAVHFKQADVDYIKSFGGSVTKWKKTAASISFEEILESIEDEELGVLLFNKYYSA